MTLYDLLIDLSQSQCRFSMKHGGYADLLRFDLEKKNIYNGNFFFMKDGEVVDTIKLTDGREINEIKRMPLVDEEMEFSVENLIKLYEQYESSVPSKHSQFSRSNFKAKTAEELTMQEMTDNMSRIEAQYRLEAFVLLGILSRKLKWMGEDKHFFWRHGNLVMFKNWFKE